MSTFTTAKNLERVANGADVGTWDVPTNSNWSIVDAALGQSVTIGLNNSNVVLSTPQYQCAQIIFNSTLTVSVTISFPSTFTGPYIVQNLCTGTSAFTITLQTTVAGGQIIGCPPGDSVNVINDGTNLKYHNIGRVGTYWDYAGSSVPNWVSACTVAPWLPCDGTTFSATTFPALAVVLGSTTLPDSRGRFRAALNQTTGRLTSSQGGVDGNTIFASGGLQTATLVTANLPPYTPSGSALSGNTVGQGGALDQCSGSGAVFQRGPSLAQLVSNFTGNAQGGTSSPLSIVPPAYVGGITLIRSA